MIFYIFYEQYYNYQNQSYASILKAMPLLCLLPFNGCRWFGTNIIDNSIYALYTINDFI